MKHTNELRMQASKHKEESFNKGMSDTPETAAATQSSTAATPISLTDQLARLNNTMGRPVIGSGLAGTGWLSNSLTANHIHLEACLGMRRRARIKECVAN